MIFQPFLLESIPSYLSTKERLELRRGVLSSLNSTNRPARLRHAVAGLDFNDSSLNDLVGLDLLYSTFELQKRR